MSTKVRSNPIYYSLSSCSSGNNSLLRTVVLHKRPDHRDFGIYIGEDVPSGLYVVTVERDSAATDADILPGDRVLAVNGQLISSMSKNPKQAVLEAASNAQRLTLTIQSTNIFKNLDVPIEYNQTDKKKSNTVRYASQQLSNIDADLERLSFLRFVQI